MKILLVGEYSRLHNSLKEGLLALGHEVTLISTGDSFKNFPSDIKLNKKYNQGFLRKLKIGFYKIFNIDITATSIKNQFYKHKEQLQGYDVVQLINESPFGLLPHIEMEIFNFLKKNNDKLFLLACGTDYTSVTHALSDAHPYSILKGYKDKTVPKDVYQFILNYTTPNFKKLHNHIFTKIDGVIASDMDYHLAYLNKKKYKGLIANPINISKLEIPEITITEPIVIFMGINRENYHTKGIVYFEEALEIIKKKIPEKVKIEIVENLPYTEYIKKYNEAHILLDQVLAYDQGYNALEAMAKGKVVFTGAETQFETYYNLKHPVAINAVPNAQKIANDLEKLILNPEMILKISAAAKQFVLKYHDHKKVAKKYLDTWSK